MTDFKATPEQWARCESNARTWSGVFNCILELRARVEALEAAQPKKITQEELAKLLAQPASVVPLATAPAGSLVEAPDELEKLLRLMNAGAGVCHSEGYEELHDAICRGVDLLERLTQQQPEPIDEAENDRRFKADAATPEQVVNSQPTPNQSQIRSSAPASSLVERVKQALEDHHVVGAIEGSWDAQARAVIREVAAWLIDSYSDAEGCINSQISVAIGDLEQEADR